MTPTLSNNKYYMRWTKHTIWISPSVVTRVVYPDTSFLINRAPNFKNSMTNEQYISKKTVLILTHAVAVRRTRIYLRRRSQQIHRPNILVYAAHLAYPWCQNVVFLGCPRKGFPNLWSWACCRWSLPLYLNVWLGFSIKTRHANKSINSHRCRYNNRSDQNWYRVLADLSIELCISVVLMRLRILFKSHTHTKFRFKYTK